MLLQDVLVELEKLGINMANSTLRNYQNDKLIPAAKRSSLGRWKGTVTEYPDHAVPEIYAAYHMMNGQLSAKVDLLRSARELVLQIEEDPTTEPPYDMIMNYACSLWVSYREKARTGKDCIVDIRTNCGKTFIECIPI